MKYVSIKRVYDLLSCVPDISELELCPSIFDDNVIRRDCDKCKSSKSNQGDTYDPDVCISCWHDAIDKAAKEF